MKQTLIAVFHTAKYSQIPVKQLAELIWLSPNYAEKSLNPKFIAFLLK